ncbi:hypothetical protein RJ639_023323, partial [Escallonia herrerae]
MKIIVTRFEGINHGGRLVEERTKSLGGYVAKVQHLEWKLIYVGSAEDETYDQLLESVLVWPVNVGNYRQTLQIHQKSVKRISLVSPYLWLEFVRVGYYVNNDYDDEQLREEPPQKVLTDQVQRNILADKPRVTKFPINFHPENEQGDQPQDEHGEEPAAEIHVPEGDQSPPPPNRLLKF